MAGTLAYRTGTQSGSETSQSGPMTRSEVCRLISGAPAAAGYSTLSPAAHCPFGNPPGSF